MDQDFIQKAQYAKNAEELFKMAKDGGMPMDSEGAAKLFARLSYGQGELSDDELANVSGGGCGGGEARESEKGLKCPSCGGHLNWDYDISWTTAICKKCKKFYVYEQGVFIEADPAE